MPSLVGHLALGGLPIQHQLPFSILGIRLRHFNSAAGYFLDRLLRASRPLLLKETSKN